jgi:hypothetical protein
MFSISPSPPPRENRAVCGKMWKNIVEPHRLHDVIIRYIRIACGIPEATNTHPEYVILIAFTLQQ